MWNRHERKNAEKAGETENVEHTGQTERGTDRQTLWNREERQNVEQAVKTENVEETRKTENVEQAGEAECGTDRRDRMWNRRTHLTPNRSINMMWFLKVLLISRSICLISAENSLACSFIICAETKNRVSQSDRMTLIPVTEISTCKNVFHG